MEKENKKTENKMTENKNNEKISTDAIIRLGYAYYAIVFLTHVLILLQVIPYQWVNGGRSVSYEAQAQLSFVSLVIALIGLIYIFLTDKIKPMRYHIAFRIFTWLLTAYWTLGFFMQLLGTPFERFGMSILVLFGIWVHARIALAKKPQREEVSA